MGDGSWGPLRHQGTHSGLQGQLGAPHTFGGDPSGLQGLLGSPTPLDPSGSSGCCEVFRTEVWITPATYSDHQGLPQQDGWGNRLRAAVVDGVGH